VVVLEEVKFWRINGKLPKDMPRMRYSVIESKEAYYLIDNDRTWWRHAFPVLNWIIPDEAMKINLSNDLINTLLINKRLSKKQNERGMTGTGIAALISVVFGSSFLFPIFDLLGIHLPTYVNLIIVIVIHTSIYIWKRRNSKKAEKILDIIGMEHLSRQKLRISPASFSQIILILFAFYILILFWLFGTFHFISEMDDTNPILFLVGGMAFFGYLHVNALFRVNLERYKIKAIDE